LCPRGFNILRDLGWDDTPDQYFDGIDNALIDRIRDPWNYRPLPFVDVERQHNESRSIEDIKREETASAIREAAQKLRSINKPSETSEAESTALASSTAVRRNSKLVAAAEKRSAELAAELAEMESAAGSKGKWDVWNQIADGTHTGYMGGDGLASGRSTSSQGTDVSGRSFFGASNEAELTSLTSPSATVDPRFIGRGSTPKAATGGGGQWSSRQDTTPGGSASSNRVGLKLDLSSIQVAPSHVPVPPKSSKPVSTPSLQENLRFSEHGDDNEEYDMKIHTTQQKLPVMPPRLGPPQMMPAMVLGTPSRPPPRLGPPGGLGPPRGGPGPSPRGPPPPRLGPGMMAGPGVMALTSLARPPGMGFLDSNRPPSSSGPSQGRRPPQ
jgi:hypothetical protein